MFKIIMFIIGVYMHVHAFASGKIVAATDINLDQVQLPEILEEIKSPTSNGMGYVFYTISPVGKAFLEQECKPGKELIEIGSGFNNIPIEALKKGVKKYTANDISSEHLSILAKRAAQVAGKELLKNLYFVCGKAPNALPRVSEKYDAILIDKVIHFMSPKDIKEFIAWVKVALKKGGKIYITAASPYSKIYNSTLAQYLSNVKEGLEFPGHFKDIRSIIKKNVKSQRYTQYQVPDEMVLFSKNDLIEFMIDNGFEVIASYALQLPTKIKNSWTEGNDEEGNVVGVIAINK